MTMAAVNLWLDKNRWLIAAGVILTALGFGVVTPNLRLGNLEAQQKQDHSQLMTTTQYLRILATAQCLSDRPQVLNGRGRDLLELMCDRVLNDPANLQLP